jgi:hypothetical protein
MALKAGSLQNLSNSMAKAMENAFIDVIVAEKIPEPEDRQQMRLLFVAIAQGVVEHLQANHDAFKVEVTLPNGKTATGEITEIE